MNIRKLSILIATLCLGAAAGMALFSKAAQAIELPPGDYLSGTDSSGADLSGDTVPAVATGEQRNPIAAEGTFQKSQHGPVGLATADRVQDNTEGWTSGVIRGDVQLAVSVLDKLGSITVIVEEMRNPFERGSGATASGTATDDNGEKAAYRAPHRFYAKVHRGEGTPTFEVRDVPFSNHPYRVTLHTANLNGSQRIVSVTKEEPLHDIVLAITPGVPFSILLRDQDSGSYPDIDLLLRPIGLPNGRPRLSGTTDNFGSVVFDNVLAGQYELVTTLKGQPFGEIDRVMVQPGTRNFGRKIQGQGHVITIERGVQVDVRVSDKLGYGIPGVTVTATATDRRKLLELEGTTDNGGNLRFSRLLPGTWQLTVQKLGWQRIDRQLTLRAHQQPMRRDFKLVRPLRRRR